MVKKITNSGVCLKTGISLRKMTKRVAPVILAGIMTVTSIPGSSLIVKKEKVEAATTWYSALYPENWTPGYTNSNGQFLHDFSYAGYEKGEKELPTTMEGLYANVKDYGADSTGATDSTSAIQSAIDAVQSAGGGTVYLPEGTYKVKPSSNEYASALKITGSNILFKGDGIGKTFIRCYAENMRYCQIITVNNGGTWDSADDGKYYYLSQDIPETPITTIHLSDLGNLAVGDWVVIRSDRTTEWINEHNMSGFWSGTLNPTTMGTTFYRKITKVNTADKTVEIDIPTRYYMKTRDNARLYKVAPKQSNVGLMDFSIGNKANSNTSGWGEEDYKTSGTGAYNTNNAFLIKFSNNINCFAKNIATYQAGNSSTVHMSSNGLDINKTRNLTVENCDFSHPQYEGGGGNGYGMNICGQETLIKNCSSTSARHSFSFKYAYANGNVIYHYTSTDPKYGSDFHMYLSMSNLIDCEELNGDFCETNIRPYGGTAGNRHGYTSTQTVFWNTKGNYYKSGSSYIIDSRQYKYGYIIGTQGAATAVKTTPTTMSSTYGTVDTAPEDYKEGIGSGETLYPQSLYHDQLAKRLARESGQESGSDTSTVEAKVIPGTFNATEYYTASSEVTKMNTDGVDYVGNLVQNSTMSYKINVEKAGYYSMNVKAVSGNSNNTRTLTFTEGSNELCSFDVTNTSSWTDFRDHKNMVYFATAGEKTLTIKSTGAANISDISFLRAEDTSVDVPTSSTAKSAGKVVGYLPSYRTYAIDSIDYSALTHLCLAFMTYKNGTLSSGFSDSDTQKIVSKCKANDVKVLIALGGGGGFDTSDQPFSTVAKRTAIIDTLVNYVNQYDLDGVDIDIEVTDSTLWANFEAFTSELSSRLKANDKLLTMAVSSWFTGSITNNTYTYFDFVNLMTYDNAFGDGEVAPWSQIYNQTSHYNGKGISNDRMTIGVPFYGYSSGAKSYTYSEILAMDAANSTRDYYNGIYYNGATTIAEKAEYSKNYAGIMIWELGQDSFGNGSLLAVIKNIMQSGNTGETVSTPVTEIPGTVKVDSYASKSDAITITTGDTTYAGNLNNGLGLDYYVKVPAAGEYTVTLKFAAGDVRYNADSMIIKINGNEVTCTDVTASSSWTTFIDHEVTVSFKEAGNYKLSIEAVNGACNVADFTITSKNGQVETTTQQQTTSPQQTTTQPETTQTTTAADSADNPAEVFGVVIESTTDNTITVVWGRNSEKEEQGQLYNVYVDDELVMTNLVCASYDIKNVDPGEHTVRVTAFIGEKETAGYSATVSVSGEKVTQPETTTEEITTQEQTTQPETTVAKEAKIEINGGQISYVNEGFRVVYSIGEDTSKIKNVGLIYGLVGKNDKSDMYIGSTNKYVHSYQATEKGVIPLNASEMENSTTYAMTMKFVKTSEFYSAGLYVRAYALLEDGSYIYTDTVKMSVYDIADELYKNNSMPNQVGHEYLYDSILSVVKPDYVKSDYVIL